MVLMLSPVTQETEAGVRREVINVDKCGWLVFHQKINQEVHCLQGFSISAFFETGHETHL